MSKSKCEKPELMPKDGKCSKDLIEKCHGKEKIIHTIKIANN